MKQQTSLPSDSLEANTLEPGKPQLTVIDVPQCELCGSSGTLIYDRLTDHFDNVDGAFGMRRCNNPECQTLWLDPQPLEDEIYLAYQRYYTHAGNVPPAGREAERSISGKARGFVRDGWRQMMGLNEERARVLSMYLEDRTPGSILDIGCGNGSRLARFLAKGWQVQGQEIDPNAAAQAQQLGIPVHVGTIDSAPLLDATYDAVVMNHVIEHVYNPLAILARAHSLLKPGGVLVAITPNANSRGHARYGEYWRGLEAPRHIHIFTSASLHRLAEKAGFADVKTWTSAAHAELLANGSYDFARHAKDGSYRRKAGSPWRIAQSMQFQIGATLAMKASPDSGEECVLWAVK